MKTKMISLVAILILLSGCTGMQIRNDPNTPVDDILMPIFMVIGR